MDEGKLSKVNSLAIIYIVNLEVWIWRHWEKYLFSTYE